MPRANLRGPVYALAVLILSQGYASGVILDWDTVSWADGSVHNSYQADPMAPGPDVTVDVASNNGAPLVPFSGAPNPQTPAVGAFFQGGLPTVENSLVCAVNLDNPTQTLTITISFANPGGVSGVSFKLFDIDAGGGSQDQLTAIRGLSVDGVTLIAPTVTTSLNNVLIGSGLGQSVVGTATAASTGPTSGLGNVSIDFGSSVIQSLTFTYGCTSSFSDPAYQHFGLHDISFTPAVVPETGPGLIGILVCLVAVGRAIERRSRLPSERSS